MTPKCHMGQSPHLLLNMKKPHCNDECHTSFLKPTSVYLPFSFDLSISPSFSLNLPMFESPFLNGSMHVCMCHFFLFSFNLIFPFSQSSYVFYIESLQKLNIIIMPLAQEPDAIVWRGHMGSKVQCVCVTMCFFHLDFPSHS